LQRQRVVEDLTHRQEGRIRIASKTWFTGKIWSSCNASSMTCTPPTSPIFLKPCRWMIV
jgi:hypothetical protein